jgi:hypothetical protein
LHLDRRRIAVLACAGVFLVIAVVFGLLAYFRVTPQTISGSHASVPVTVTGTVTPTPNPNTGGSPAPAAAVTVTQTVVVAVPPSSGGSTIGSLESLAGALSGVVAAACAVIALRPRGRGRPPTAAAAAADAPASTPST